MNDFLIRALLAGVAVALIAGPLGSFVVWRRLAYFGDTLAHSALLGVALGFLLGVSVNLAVIAVCLSIAILLVIFQQKQQLANDTLLGILAHAALSLGLVAMSFIEGVRVDLMAYLFGDILAITSHDLAWIYGGSVLALLILLALWRPLLSMTVHEELARVEGVPVTWVNIGLMLLIAIVVAVAMKIIGILLITALLIIPAATARRLAGGPEQMAVVAALLGCAAVGGGLMMSLRWDTPAGPSIVVVAAILFVVINLLPIFGRRSRT